MHATRWTRIAMAVAWITLVVVLAVVQPAQAQLKTLPKTEKPRVIVLTDIGGDRDDEQSFTRFLLYADQFDIEGLLATSIRIYPKQKHRPPDGAPQPHYIARWVKAYGQVRENLLKHSEDWPEADALLAMIRRGTLTGRNADFDITKGVASSPDSHFPLDQILGEGKDTEVSMHIIEVVDRDDPRPVWISVWGGPIELAQALWRVRNDRSKEEVERFVAKLRVYAWGHQDLSGPWIQKNFLDLFYIVSTGGILYSADPKLRSKEWLNTHVRLNHGPLGALCPLRKGELGGADSETYLGLIPNGLSTLEHPDWGGWGGRFKHAHGSETQWIDLISDPKPEEKGATISRWAPHFQNDYQARMDWCVKEFSEANHPPRPVLNGDESLRPLEITAKPGQRIELDATGSSDIDKGDTLSYEWKFYPEFGTYPRQVDIENASNITASLIVPDDALGTVLHVILNVTDSGSPPLTRYKRLVVQCE